MPVKRYFLKGIDYFQLLIDHHNKRLGGHGHEARLVIHLDGLVNEMDVAALIDENELCRQLQSVHVSKSSGLGYPSLVFKKTNIKIPITFEKVDGNELPGQFLNEPVDVYRLPPLHVRILHFNNNTSCLLFTFHHILFDFAGVQSFINSLAGMKKSTLLPAEFKPAPFAVRFKRFFNEVFFTFREANFKMTVPERELPCTKPLNITYREIEFSETETVSIYENCNRRGISLNRSIYQVACVSKALHDEIFSKQKHHNFIWVPVPVNVRKKGTNDAIVLNGLSFLFYKLTPEVLNSLDTTIAAIQQQMKDQMRRELPAAFIDFADGYWYMPMPFYYPMMKLPSWGKLSSFSFSTLGNTFAGLNEFMGFPVRDIRNYPSNSISPGFTFLFYEFRGHLRLMSSWVEGQYTPSEQESVLSRIKELLLK